MTAVWWTIVLLVVGTLAIKGAGPLVLGEHEPTAWMKAVIALLAPALLAALVIQQSLATEEGGLRIDARLVGVGVAVLALLARLALIVVIVLAAASAALFRLVV